MLVFIGVCNGIVMYVGVRYSFWNKSYSSKFAYFKMHLSNALKDRKYNKKVERITTLFV